MRYKNDVLPQRMRAAIVQAANIAKKENLIDSNNTKKGGTTHMDNIFYEYHGKEDGEYLQIYNNEDHYVMSIDYFDDEHGKLLVSQESLKFIAEKLQDNITNIGAVFVVTCDENGGNIEVEITREGVKVTMYNGDNPAYIVLNPADFIEFSQDFLQKI